ADHASFEASVHTDHVEVVRTHAGQHCDGEDDQFGIHLGRGVDSGAQHLAAAGRMHGEHAYAELRCFPYRGAHSVRNVVIFQVEEYSTSRGDEVPHNLRTFSRIELHSDLVRKGRVAHRRHDLPGGGGRRNVQRNNQPLSRIGSANGTYFPDEVWQRTHPEQSKRVLRELRYRRMVVGDRLINLLLLAGGNQIQTDTLQSAMTDLQGLGCAVRQVDNPARDDGSPVVYPDYNGLAVAQVRHLHIASDGKREVSRCHVVHLVRFAASGRFSLKVLAVPGSCSDLKRLRFCNLWPD